MTEYSIPEPITQSLDYIKSKCSHDDTTSVSTASLTAHSQCCSPLPQISNGTTAIVQQSQVNEISFEAFPISNLSVEQPINEFFLTLESEKKDDHNVNAISTPIVDFMPSLAKVMIINNSETSLNSSISDIRNKALFSADESEDGCASITDGGSQGNSLLLSGDESDNISFPIVDLLIPNHTMFDQSKLFNRSVCGKRNKTGTFSLESDDENCSISCNSLVLDDDSLLDLIRATNNTLTDNSPRKSLATYNIANTEVIHLADEDDGLEKELIQLEHSEMEIQHEIDHAIDQIAYRHKSTEDWAGEGFFNGICRGGEGDGICYSNEIDIYPVENRQEDKSFMDGVAHAFDKACCMDKCMK